jgi:PAS domain S-box-containing protein
MQSDRPTRRAGVLRSWVPYWVLISSLLLTAAVTYAAANAIESKDRLRFDLAVQRTSAAIKNRLETYIAMLLSGTGLFAANEDVNRDKFHAFVDRLDLQRRYPGIQGIGYSVRMRPEERAEVMARQQAQGYADFNIRPAHDRPEYHAIIYLEPLDRRNKAAIGYDMFSEKVRREAMERSRDGGLPAMSGRVTLVQEIDEQKQAGFLIYVPIYDKGMPHETAEQRQAALKGFVYSPFRADDLLHGILSSEVVPIIDFWVYDGSSAEQNLLHASNPNRRSPSASPLHAVSTIDVAGRSWTLVASAQQSLYAASARGAIPYIALGGLLISALLFTVTRSQVRARSLAEQSAAELKQSEAALRKSERHIRKVLDAVCASVGVIKPDGTLVEVNQAMLTLASLKSEDVLGKPIDEAYWWSHSDQAKDELRAAIARATKGEIVQFDARMRVAEDRIRTIDLTLTPLSEGTGPATYLILTCIDITDRLDAEEGRAALREEMIHMQADRLAELSTPLIPLSSDILLMPLIGTVDPQRALQVLDAIAQGVASKGARIAIIDITGVPTVDTQSASVLLQTAQVVRLLGAEVVLTGVKPAVAQALVHLGLELTGIATLGDLQSGINYALKATPGAKR